jgi:hypothetical protein
MAKITADYTNCLTVQERLLAKMYGRTAGVLLYKIHYWIEKKAGEEVGGTRWVFNTAEGWAEQVYVSARQIQNIVSKLLKDGIIKIAKLHKNKWNRTNFYTINYDLLFKRISEFCNSNKPTKTAEETETLVGEPVEQAQSLNLSTISELQTFVADSVEAKAPANNQSNTTVQDMVRVWNECLGEKAKARPNLQLSPLLVSAFKTKFGSSLVEWGNYCEQLKSSSYIMGKTFNLSISWALSFSTVDRIRNCELGVMRTAEINKPAVDSDVDVEKSKLEKEINALDATPLVKAVISQVLKEVGTAECKAYFLPSTFEETKGKVIITAANDWAKRHISDNYNWLIDKIKKTCSIEIGFGLM